MENNFICANCQKPSYKRQAELNRNIREGFQSFCSRKCSALSRKTGTFFNCPICNKEFYKIPHNIADTKNHFCSRRCAAFYNQAHKTHGCRRSKLEIYIEEQLTIIYPELNFMFNSKTAINSELDIYIPSLKLAFELNGIFHYEPIYGQNKLDQIQNNDNRKFQACIENGIELCIIDSTKLKYFKPDNAKKYLDIVCSIINKRTEKDSHLQTPDCIQSL